MSRSILLFKKSIWNQFQHILYITNQENGQYKSASNSKYSKLEWNLYFKKYLVYYYAKSGADLGFSRGGGGFSKILTFFFFLGRPNWFFELSQSTALPLFWQNFLRRRQIFWKTVKKAVFGQFLKNFDKKIAFFLARAPPQS